MALATSALIAAGLLAAAGAAKGASNNAKNAEDNAFRKNVITYSPWTHMADPGRANRSGVFDNALAGGTSGLLLGQSLGAGGLSGAAPAAGGTGLLGVDTSAAALAPGAADTVSGVQKNLALGGFLGGAQGAGAGIPALTSPTIGGSSWAGMSPYKNSYFAQNTGY